MKEIMYNYIYTLQLQLKIYMAIKGFYINIYATAILSIIQVSAVVFYYLSNSI